MHLCSLCQTRLNLKTHTVSETENRTCLTAVSQRERGRGAVYRAVDTGTSMTIPSAGPGGELGSPHPANRHQPLLSSMSHRGPPATARSCRWRSFPATAAPAQGGLTPPGQWRAHRASGPSGACLRACIRGVRQGCTVGDRHGAEHVVAPVASGHRLWTGGGGRGGVLASSQPRLTHPPTHPYCPPYGDV